MTRTKKGRENVKVENNMEGEVGVLEEEPDARWDREHGLLAKLEGGILVRLSGKWAEEAKDTVRMGRCCWDWDNRA